jgi:hypothetical protein
VRGVRAGVRASPTLGQGRQQGREQGASKGPVYPCTHPSHLGLKGELHGGEAVVQPTVVVAGLSNLDLERPHVGVLIGRGVQKEGGRFKV